MAWNTRSQQQPGSARLSTWGSENPMEEALDRGALRSNKRDRDFTTFLDLKSNYHKQFIDRLRDHVEQYGFDWEVLQRSDIERKSCAESFLRAYGMLYWGTELNRQKYLMENSLADPESLSIYPERKNEITRAIAILLERKAKSNAKLNQTQAPRTPTATPANPRTSTIAGATKLFLDSTSRQSTGKRKLREDLSTSPPQSEDDSDTAKIRPFRSVTEIQRPFLPKKRRISRPSQGRDILDKAETSNVEHTLTENHTESSMMGNQTFEEKHQRATRFLVSASNQPDMAPVWVPFQNFSSASSFLALMANECRIREWDPSAQLKSEISNWNSSTPSAQMVVAASVKFEWSGFAIRVRQGKDEDWQLITQELHKSWRVKGENADSGLVDAFHISVKLHIT